MLEWFGRIDWHGNSKDFARSFGDKSLPSAIDALSDHVYHDGKSEMNLEILLTGMKQARKVYLDDCRTDVRSALPPLNP